MRIVKMSANEFENVRLVHAFFKKTLPKRDGAFTIPPGWIAEDGLHEGEPLLFSYEGMVLYAAMAASGRRENNDDDRRGYPFYFRIDVASLRPVKITLAELEKKLHATGRKKKIVHSQGWPTMPDSAARTRLWLSLPST